MLLIIVTTLLITLILNIILKKIQLPPIIGYIFTGTIITYLFGLFETNHELKEIAEFGVVFLMFTIGLEFSIDHLKKMRYQVFVLGTLQVAITGIILLLITNYVLNLDSKTSVVVAMAITLSSTAIVLKTFNETGEINRSYGKNSLGILIMQDIAVIPILLIISFLSTTTDESTFLVVIKMLFSGFILLAILWLIGKYLLEPFLTAIVKTESDELFVTAILFLTIGASYLAHIFGFSYSLGAFIAGMLIAETKYKHQVETDLIPFRDILLGIFFITVGMQINLSLLADNIAIILMLLPAIFILKFSVIFFITQIKSNKKTGFKTALALVQIGEFSLAILELSNTTNLISHEYTQILIVTTVISMVLTPMILLNISSITSFFINSQDEEMKTNNIEFEEIKEKVLILGYGELGQNIAHTLMATEIPYAIIENNIDKYHIGVQNGEPIIFGNGAKKSILQVILKNKNQKVIVAVNNPKKLYQICEAITTFVEKDNIIVKVHGHKDMELLDDLGINHIIIENEVVSARVLRFLI